MIKIGTVRDLIEKLKECDLDSLIWLSTDAEDPELDRYSLITGILFDDDDSEEAREIGRKKYGTEYLRVPILITKKNQ